MIDPSVYVVSEAPKAGFVKRSDAPAAAVGRMNNDKKTCQSDPRKSSMSIVSSILPSNFSIKINHSS